MTTKQASAKFHIDEKEIRKRNKDGMIIGSTKEHGLIIIPDATKIIPSKADVQAFLFQVLKYKNNKSIIIAQQLFPDVYKLKIIAEYLFLKGYIGKYDEFEDEKEFFNAVQITDSGMQLVFGSNAIQKFSSPIVITFAPTAQLNIVNL